MSYYGVSNQTEYTVHKRRLQPNGEFRFGGIKNILAYKVPESVDGSVEVPVDVQLGTTVAENVYVVKTGDSSCVVVALKPNSDMVTIETAALHDVVDSFVVEPGLHAIVLEGSLTTHDGQVHDSATTIPIVKAIESQLVLTGSGKVLVLKLSV